MRYPFIFLLAVIWLLPEPLFSQDTTQLASQVKAQPWRLSEALSLPNSLKISGEQRSRYELLGGQFRAVQPDPDQIIALRTLLKLEYNHRLFGFTAEMQDSRQYLGSADSPVNTGIVNTFSLLQAYVTLKFKNGGEGESTAYLDLGRLTMDIGSRKFMARNRYRNTINNYTGLHGAWRMPSGTQFRYLYVLPIQKLPEDRDALLNNESQLDRERWDTQFWGLYLDVPHFYKDLSADFSFFGLHERDSPERNTRNRRLYTPTFRIYRKPKAGQWDYSVETALQWGKSRLTSSPSDNTNLDHLAYFQHIELGYSLNLPWLLRFQIQGDYAGGDRNPGDKQNQRFDSLYGVPRFDFGPTSLLRTFTRSNLISPGLRLYTKPHTSLDIMCAHRWYWLASETDAWTATGIQDLDGSSGSYLGHQFETRVRWDVLPKNIRLEFGFAQLFTGSFMNQVSEEIEANLKDVSYGYFQTFFYF